LRCAARSFASLLTPRLPGAQISKLDNWKSGILLGIKTKLKQLTEAIDDAGADVDLR
jgi:hypothetical protein